MQVLEENLSFLIASICIVVAVYFVALLFQKIIEKRDNRKFHTEKTKVSHLVIIAMFTAISVVLMYIDFPLPFLAPPFYRIDFSEVPILIGAFMLGPCAGVMMEALKNLLMLVVKGTSTAFVGELANFIVGCLLVVPASIVYHFHRTKKRAVISLIVGTVCMTAGGVILNAVYLLPKYSELYGMPVSAFIEMGSAINSSVNDIYSFVAICVGPFNLVKAVIVSIIVMLLYPHLSRFLKGSH
ncbi:MAG: ECF transporter S component [Lachnospiraceae bacterium]|jgi:riboflavin transporter FmnP